MRHRNRPIPGADDRYLHERCKVAPSPEAQERLKAKLEEAADRAGLAAGQVGLVPLDRGGYNDGLIKPGTDLPLGTPLRVARRGALDRAPLRGQVRVLVVLVDFSDKADDRDAAALPGPVLLDRQAAARQRPRVLQGSQRRQDHHHRRGGRAVPHAAAARRPTAAADPAPTTRRRTRGRWPARRRSRPTPSSTSSPTTTTATASSTPSSSSTPAAAPRRRWTPNDIWSHKWVFGGGALNADGTKVFAYLTVPEDCKIGVCAHELGHLLFGWPDLYDTDESSSGLGNWCLMAGGSWNGDGDIPAHPSAWCKASAGLGDDRQPDHVRHADDRRGQDRQEGLPRCGRTASSAQEYFLVEHRARDQVRRQAARRRPARLPRRRFDRGQRQRAPPAGEADRSRRPDAPQGRHQPRRRRRSVPRHGEQRQLHRDDDAELAGLQRPRDLRRR